MSVGLLAVRLFYRFYVLGHLSKWFTFFLSLSSSLSAVSCRFTLAGNVLGLCDGGAIEAQIFNFALKFNRRTTVELCSFAPLLQNPC